MAGMLRLLLLAAPPDAEAIRDTVRQVNACYNAACAYGFAHGLSDTAALSRALYRVLAERYPAVRSDLRVRAIADAARALRRARRRQRLGRPATCPRAVRRAIRYDYRTAAIAWSDGTVRLSTTRGPRTIPFTVPTDDGARAGAVAVLIVRGADRWCALRASAGRPVSAASAATSGGS